ncbi:MAG: two-component sensor histidine kinase [Thalassobium sp.]|jgi:two-component system sensor histidine kinase RstB|uniref:histidine kinase n=1 Tax=Thalassolituus pacificus TaxID=2975440 RepID=A0A9X3AD42_9GAMM|nr:ATP-binding protein [Thalassolituus pacificus]MCT7357422.1 ATP-binding protein [Thalassolituus pacificus]PHS63245.1 MAG: two-component sensor histidine kinase [Thalassobium sp.]
MVGIICTVALQLVNFVRSAQFNEDMVGGSVALLAQRLRQDPGALSELSSRFDADISILPLAEGPVDEYQQNRLARGQLLVDTTNEGRTARLLYQMSDDELLDVQLSTVTEVQAQASAYLLLEDWQRSGETIEAFIKRMQPRFGFPLSVVEIDQLFLSDSDFARMQYGDVLVRISIEGQQAEALAKLPGQPRALRLGPIDAFNPYSWQAIFVIAVIGIMLLGLGVYWVVNSFEIRLRKLEQATSRLAQGHLSARVAITGTDPVSRLGQAFNKMAEHIQRLISIQREMVRAVSHELRTPVARIRFGLQIIEDSVDDAYVSKQLTGMDSDIQELDELIDEILTYARLEEGGPLLDFQKVNVADVAVQVVEEARPPAHVSVSYAGASPENAHYAEVEPRYIHRAIQNLVGNAGRYASSRVRVSCTIGTDTCRVDVEDDGPGIPEEDWDRVFTAFARLDDSRTRSSGGYGLGLSIVRRIAYWHGGRAMVSRSEALGGAKFSLIWPRRHHE